MFCLRNAEVEVQLLKMHLPSISGRGRIFAAPDEHTVSTEDSHKSFNISFKPQLQQWKLVLRKLSVEIYSGIQI